MIYGNGYKWRNARLGFTSESEYGSMEDGVEHKGGRTVRKYCSVAGQTG